MQRQITRLVAKPHSLLNLSRPAAVVNITKQTAILQPQMRMFSTDQSDSDFQPRTKAVMTND